MSEKCQERKSPSSGVSNDALAGITGGDVGELALERVGRLRRAVDDERSTGQRLEGGADRAVRIVIMRPGDTAAQRANEGGGLAFAGTGPKAAL
jgi:hypothetical protein